MEQLSLDELFFHIIHNLCSIYGGLDPLRIQEQSFHDVIMLYADLRRMQIHDDKQRQANTTPGGIRKVRASDDAGWW